MDIIVTSHYKFDNNLIVSKKLSFQDYLFTCLKHGEKSNKIIYIYINLPKKENLKRMGFLSTKGSILTYNQYKEKVE